VSLRVKILAEATPKQKKLFPKGINHIPNKINYKEQRMITQKIKNSTYTINSFKGVINGN